MKSCFKQVGDAEVFMCATVCAGLTNCRLKSKVEEKTYCLCHFPAGRDKYCHNCKQEIKEVEEKLKEETAIEYLDNIVELLKLGANINLLARFIHLRNKIQEMKVEDSKKETDSQAELVEMIAKIHDDIEGRYELDSYDKGVIHSLLCKLQD